MNTIRLKLGFVILTLTVLAASGCSGNRPAASSPETAATAGTKAQQPFERTIQHAAGETVLTEAPRNIAILDYSFIDYLTALETKPGSTVTFARTNCLPIYPIG
ncbi:hypothetical protein FE783_00685 [Paenibacillus mesophilus]|uniref:hypothetical protein n=1 Tax=Paenibacillus mesophilus TaxID=2582849 RepID=UPI00110E05D5|nr:hypothetical protein [Paenibacillus mesophilus]TMV52745.1 hypothetical protein FE783_00685 [Paenibacillus mesophilus]